MKYYEDLQGFQNFFQHLMILGKSYWGAAGIFSVCNEANKETSVFIMKHGIINH